LNFKTLKTTMATDPKNFSFPSIVIIFQSMWSLIEIFSTNY
jgi:hypothetical protein